MVLDELAGNQKGRVSLVVKYISTIHRMSMSTVVYMF